MWCSGARCCGATVLALTVFAAAPGTQGPGTQAPSTFEFHNNFWVNLHHVVRGEARRRATIGPLRVKPGELSDSERAIWNRALDTYAELAKRDVVFDETLIRINNTLTVNSSEASLDSRGLPPAVARALTSAAPIYRAHYWAAQRQLNDHWIASLQPRLAQHSAAMAGALERAYHATWPSAPIVVDACAEAGPNGGYTTDGPPGTAAHTTIEAANPQYQGDMAFEMLFHEASHARQLGGTFADSLYREARSQNAQVPRDLLHVVIFYTAGELTRRELGMMGDAHYMPFAYRYQVYSGGWERLRNAVVAHWQPYLDGSVTYDAAIAALVKANQ